MPGNLIEIVHLLIQVQDSYLCFRKWTMWYGTSIYKDGNKGGTTCPEYAGDWALLIDPICGMFQVSDIPQNIFKY
jgi:hypothetical protein